IASRMAHRIVTCSIGLGALLMGVIASWPSWAKGASGLSFGRNTLDCEKKLPSRLFASRLLGTGKLSSVLRERLSSARDSSILTWLPLLITELRRMVKRIL